MPGTWRNQGVDIADATAIAGEVLSGETFYAGVEPIKTGTMPNIGTQNITPSTANQSISAGYHNGSGIVSGDADLVAENILSGVNIFGVTGTLVHGIGYTGNILIPYDNSVDVIVPISAYGGSPGLKGVHQIGTKYYFLHTMQMGGSGYNSLLALCVGVYDSSTGSTILYKSNASPTNFPYKAGTPDFGLGYNGTKLYSYISKEPTDNQWFVFDTAAPAAPVAVGGAGIGGTDSITMTALNGNYPVFGGFTVSAYSKISASIYNALYDNTTAMFVAMQVTVS